MANGNCRASCRDRHTRHWRLASLSFRADALYEVLADARFTLTC